MFNIFSMLTSLRCTAISLVLFPLCDFALSSLFFVHGNQWIIFVTSISHFSFPTSFVDLWFLACIRSGMMLGGIIGILKNPIDGPTRCQNCIWPIGAFACINGYYACIKLLAFSDGKEFIAGPKLYWFWALFGSTIIASLLCIIFWQFLSSLNNESNVTSSKEDCVEEQPLLDEKYHNLSDDCFAETVEEVNRKSVTQDSGVSDSFNIDILPSINSYQCSTGSNAAVKDKKAKDSTSSDDDKTKGYRELLNKATLGTMLSYSIPDWPWIVCGFIFLTVASASQVFIPLYTGKVISGIVVSKDSSKFTKDIIIMAFISLLAAISAGLRGGCFMTAIQKLNIRVRNALFKSITNQEIGFFDDMKTGAITSRLTSDTTTMSSTICLNINVFLRNLIKSIGVCVFMIILSWRMTILTFMGLPLVIGVSKLYGNYYKKLQKQVQDRFAIANEVAEEVCSSMQTVRSFANEEGERKRYDCKLQDVYKVQFKQAASYSGFVWSTQTIELMLTVATLWFGGHLLLQNNLTAEHFISFILYQESLGECFSQMGEVYTGLMQALGAAEKVFELIDRKPVIGTDDGIEQPDEVKGHISFKNVCFSYPMRPDQPVLRNVSFEVKSGEVVALVGPSGGGKSSCVKLLQRFYDPNSGSVLLDGLPISAYKHDYLHSKVSMVGQEPVLYARSIRDNIVYGLDRADYPEEKILEASVKANCHNFIMELPEKYDTESGEKGTQLSGGQKQRIAIARAMVRNPRVLLLDEATSALDTESEYLVQEALDRSKSHRTVLLIAHRLSTVERADKIVVIVKGQVKEIGSHKKLMEKQGVYYNLVRRQLHLTDSFNEGPANAIDCEKSSIKERDVFDDFITLPNRDMQLLSTSLSSNSSVSSAVVKI